MKSSIEKIKQDLKENVTEYRYEHSLRTMETAVKLARHYGYNEKKAALAALTHDIAKELTEEEKKKIIKDYQIKVIEDDTLKLSHAYIGSIITKEKYNFNKEMTDAILYHTTGRVNMSLLDKIVFVADKIEQGKTFLGIDEERKLAFIDLDKAVICCIENKIRKKKLENKKINKDTLEVLESLKAKSANAF